MKLSPTQEELWRVAAFAVVAAALALATGYAAISVLACTIAYLGWHLVQLLRLRRRLVSGEAVEPPFPRGLWRTLYESVRRAQHRGQKARGRLSRFAARFRDAAAAFPDAVVLLNRRFEVRWSNTAAREIFALARTPGVDQTLAELVGDPMLTRYFETGDFRRPLMIPSPVDRAKIVALRIAPFGKKKKDQYVLVASDVTRVYHLDAARRDFVANVSHELRSPLTVITGYLEALSDALGEDEEWNRSLEVMLQQAQRMRDMIHDLLLLSRLEGDGGVARDTRVRVAEMIAEIVGDARTMGAKTRHTFDVQSDTSTGLLGNADEIRSGFSNLVFNALLHTPPGTTIAVRWERRDEGGACFAVADDGPGIAARHLPRLSERFYRVDPGRSRQSGGTGLGLAIVKHVVQGHSGQLEVASDVGRGTTFTCRFPEAVLFDANEKSPEETEPDSPVASTPSP